MRIVLLMCFPLFVACQKLNPVISEVQSDKVYTMPGEHEEHEATWLQWPHDYTYSNHRSRLEPVFVDIAKALAQSEKLHVIVYDSVELVSVRQVLDDEGVDSNIHFFVAKTNDYWVRDNGPIFVKDDLGNRVIQNWGFNGWGKKAPWRKCTKVPNFVGDWLSEAVVDVSLVNEGGSIEIDGNGTLMAKKSSIINSNRNKNLNQSQIEAYFRTYLGISNFIWLEGIEGEDITDDHIDGTARFANDSTLVTFYPEDSYEGEYAVLSQAKNKNGESYSIIHLPRPVTEPNGTYINFYTGNLVVLVPIFGEPNDEIALNTLQSIYPNREVIGIRANELAKDGGGIHCVTQQQPK